MSETMPTQSELDADEELLDRIVDAAGLAVEEALLDHKRAGNPIVAWQDGQVVWIAPEDIEV